MSQYPTGNLEVNNDHKRVRSHDIDPWQPTGLLSGKLVLWTGWVDSVSTLTLARLSILPRCHCKHGSPPRSKLYPENIWGRGGFSVCSMQNWWQVGGPIVSTLAWDAQLIYDNNELVYFSLPPPRKINIAPEKKALKTEDYFPLVLPAWLHPNAVFMGCLCRFDATACQVPRCRHTAFPFFPSRISVAWRPSSCWTSLQSIQFIKWYF